MKARITISGRFVRVSSVFHPWLLLLPLLFLTGCAERPITAVTGKVTFNGQPLTSGRVTLYGKGDWRPRSGAIKDDGTYTVQRVPVGVIFAAVESPEPSGPATSEAKERAKSWFPIPRKYSIVAHSDLMSEVQEGANTYDIHLRGSVGDGRRASR